MNFTTISDKNETDFLPKYIEAMKEHHRSASNAVNAKTNKQSLPNLHASINVLEVISMASTLTDTLQHEG